jgi:hypothetical protein
LVSFSNVGDSRFLIFGVWVSIFCRHFFPHPFSLFRVQILFQFSFSNIRRVCRINLGLWFSCFSSFLFIFSAVHHISLEFNFFFVLSFLFEFSCLDSSIHIIIEWGW